MPEVCDVVNEPLKTKDAPVTAPLIAAVPVTARALLPSVAPFRARDVPVPAPIAVLVTAHVVHAIVSTMSFRAAATAKTTVVPLEAV